MDDEITIEQIAAEMDELGRTKLELAIARVQGRRQARRIAELENAQQPGQPPAPVDATQGGDGG